MSSKFRYGYSDQDYRRSGEPIRSHFSHRSKSGRRLSRGVYNLASEHVGASSNMDYNVDKHHYVTGGSRRFLNSSHTYVTLDDPKTRNDISGLKRKSFIGYLRDTFSNRRSQPTAEYHDGGLHMNDAASRSRARSRRRPSSRSRTRHASAHTHYHMRSRHRHSGSGRSTDRSSRKRSYRFHGGSNTSGDYTYAARSGRVRRRGRRSSRRRGPRAGGYGDASTNLRHDGDSEYTSSDPEYDESQNDRDNHRSTSNSLNEEYPNRLNSTSMIFVDSRDHPPLSSESQNRGFIRKVKGVNIKGTQRKLPFVKSPSPMVDFIHIRLLRLLEPISFSDAMREDELLHNRGKILGNGTLWHSADRPDYDEGKMYTSAPPKSAIAWKRTAKQARALILCLSRDSLRNSIMNSYDLTNVKAVMFLINVGMKIAANVHRDGMARYGNIKLVSSLQFVPEGDAEIFEADVIHAPRGPAASVLRACYGAIAYWPELRCILEQKSRAVVRYAISAMLQAECVLLARISSHSASLTVEELRILSACVTMICVVATLASHFLYAALGQLLHRNKNNGLYAWLRNNTSSQHLPMHSIDLLHAEGACLGGLEASFYGPKGTPLGMTIVRAYIVARTSFTELMNEVMSRENAFLEKETDETGEYLISAIIAVTIVLQRLLGYLNIVVAQLTIASEIHDREVGVWSETFIMYRYLSYVCKCLYRPVTVEEYIKERNEAMDLLDLKFARGDPPMEMSEIISGGGRYSELDTLELIPPPVDYDVLGNIVPLKDALLDAKDVIFEPRPFK
ncbi:UL47 tegument phosphoprotein [Meleagrid alphaherpesvirus 1]|uniref:Tegument protein UL47 n=1 Tax=Meleagrid herpesvirus 1 TaxID=37108 RepID=Q9DGV9_MEHV1|nr:tegument protein VP13/14 [Meleagrid alphaherpesvirus 1]AKQ48594.1 tegument protein VP13/14 [iBAC vector pMeHV1-C7]AKQ48666.1 tegument protein VP13/14 [iBAC vector pMeHV1-C9]AKQ48738.1 tegument protein VP13/14 [iBAC vector pMeHV1-C10]AKQ48810.1 tegument protein VP13/14 [iBAC vector pMeHV1-C17]AKQ48882.1 tegument protein VP13/14 [iBAC vector pMeHV1-C18]